MKGAQTSTIIRHKEPKPAAKQGKERDGFFEGPLASFPPPNAQEGKNLTNSSVKQHGGGGVKAGGGVSIPPQLLKPQYFLLPKEKRKPTKEGEQKTDTEAGLQ